jgi:GNAT superfamily N-acetyltransferase
MRSASALKSHQFHDLAGHFLALNADDRRLRFGWVISDAGLVAYVENAMRVADDIFVVEEPSPDIAGAACMDFYGGCADLGLSVSGGARCKGIGRCLLERAALHAGVRGVRTMFVFNLDGNEPLRRLARAMGMRIALEPGGGSTRLELPPLARGIGSGGAIPPTITLADRSLRFDWAAPKSDAPSTIDRRETSDT